MTEPEPNQRYRTPLLELISREAVDRDYEARARRRRADGEAPPAQSHVTAGIVIAVFGLLITLAAAQRSANAEVDEASRVALIDRIEARRTVIADLRNATAATREQNAAQLDRVLSLSGAVARAEARADLLALTSGFGPVTGPGLRVTVEDAADGSADGRVRASDLRLLVNALWSVGAEAIAVNGRRITALTGIVNADIAIQVNKGPVAPPYVVEAIGGSDLAPDLVESQSGIAFLSLARQFGFGVTRENVAFLSLSGAGSQSRRILYAEAFTDVQPPKEGETPQ
jgi:uncharacterized protein YlxW (UPF0749 family)